jgi:hypothetical protein
VRVAVEGHGYAGVSQKVLYEFRVNAALQKQGGACVLEVVPANGGRLARPRSGLKWLFTMF